MVELMVNLVELQLQYCDIFHLLHYLRLKILQLRCHLGKRAFSRVSLEVGLFFYFLQVSSDLVDAVIDMHLQRV